MRKLIVILAFFLSSCATFKDPDTFIVCKTLDIASTEYVIRTGVGQEANPLVKPLIANGYAPLIILSIGAYLILKKYGTPEAITVANAVTCGAAVNNLLLIH